MLPSLKLVVLRVADVRRAARFYGALGLPMREEKHGDGPLHYAATLGGVVLELYPRAADTTAGARIAFDVDDPARRARAAVRAGGSVIRDGRDAVTLADPDGHRVILSRGEGFEPAESAPVTGRRSMRSGLTEAQRDGRLVRVFRASIESRYRLGRVVAIGRKLLLLAVVDEAVTFDGFEVLRVRDVTRVDVLPLGTSFVERALAMRGLAPRPAPAVRLDSVGGLLSSAAASRSVVTLHLEVSDPDVCWIGRVEHVGRGRVRLREISASATWRDEPSTYAVADVTRVDLGGRYEDALLMVAGEPGGLRPR